MNAKIWGRWVSRLFSQRKSVRQLPAARRRLAVEPLEDRVTPTTFIWTGGGTNSNWSTGANWQGGVAPTSLANPDLVFSLALTPLSERTTTNDLANLSVKSITISAPNYTLNGSNKVLLDGNVTIGVGATAARMNLDVQLTAVSSFTVNNNADLTVNSHLSGSATMTKKGVGSMTLSNDNLTYSGSIDVQTGRLIMSHVNALGTTAASTTVEANAQLQIRNVPTTINETLILNGPGPTNDGALLNFSGNSTWGGSITMDSDSTFGVASTTTGPTTVHHTLSISGVISDTGFTGGHNLTKVGTGTLVFSRTGGNTYRGQTVVNNGILRIQDPLSLGAGATAGTPQSGSPQSATIVNTNSTTGEAGTLQLNFAGLPNNDANGLVQNRNLPFHPVNNPFVGFQVFNDLLTLNGPGFNPTGLFGEELGALSNLNGNNSWNGDVTLGSPFPNTSDIEIGVSADSELSISGVVNDSNRISPNIPNLIKVMPGRLILDNENIYHGSTIVRVGSLNIRDSKALGIDGPTGGSVIIEPGASLELAVDSGLDGTAQRTHGRNLGFDSVRGSGTGQEVVVTGTVGNFILSLDGDSTGLLPFNASAALVQSELASLPAIGAGNVTVVQTGTVYRITFTGALLGENVPLISAVATGNTTAVVNPVYGLTVDKDVLVLGLNADFTGALRSVTGINRWTGSVDLGDFFNPTGSIAVDLDSRPAHPTADASYFTNDYSLTIATPGAFRSEADTTFHKFGEGQLILPFDNPQRLGATIIAEGWITVQDDLSLGPVTADVSVGETVQPHSIKVNAGAALHLLAGTDDITLPNNIILFGTGITHPFAMLEQGAVLSLGGKNVLSGDIELGSFSGFDGAGIGVDDLDPNNPAEDSTLTTTGTISDFSGSVINLTLTAGGFEPEQRFPIDTGGLSGTIIISSYAFYSIPDQLKIYYPPRALGGALIFDSGLVSDPPPPALPPVITVNYGPGTSTFVEIVMNEGGGQPGTAWDIFEAQIIPNTPPGSNGFIKMGSRRLNVQGDGTFTGAVEVQSGTLRVQNDSALGREGSGTAIDPTTQSFATTNTTVNAGAMLEMDSTIVQNAGGFAAGVQVWDERLILNGAGQQVAVHGTTGTFTLTFNGQTTAALDYNVSAAGMQTALTALSSIGGVGGTVTVTLEGNIYTVTFGGTLAGQNNQLLTGTPGPAPGNLTVVVSGTNFPVSVLGQDNIWRGPITLAADTTFDVADNSRLTLYGPIGDTTNPAESGSGLTVGQVGSGNTGELVLAGTNTYRGTTRVKQGILTITKSGALGGIGGPEVQTVTVGGSTSGTFTLTFDGHTTGPLNRNATALQVQNALNQLPSIGDAGGSVSVTKTGNNYAVTFGGGVLTGADQAQMTAAGAGGTTAVVSTTSEGFGGTVVDMGAQMQLQGSLTIAGESLTISGTGVDSANVPEAIPLRWFTIGSSPINNAQTTGNNASTGRVTGVSIDHSDSNVIYISTAGGGAWKTKNGGLTWTPLFDNTAAMFSGSVAVAPSDPRVIYLGTGESNNSGDSFYGTGVYKSTDSGRTWVHLTGPGGVNPLEGTAVSRLIVDASNSNRVYVATTDSFIVNSNAGIGTAGVWRHDGNNWVNLTAITSNVRQGQFPAPNSGFPAAVTTPGPDDNFGIVFPSTNASYSDLHFGTSTDAFGNRQPALYMALGTPFSNFVPANGVYRLLNPAQAGTPQTTHWYFGNGNPVVNGTHTYSTGGGSPFPIGNLTTGASRNSTIKIGVGGLDDPDTIIDETSLTIYAAITDADDPATPPPNIEAGMLLRIVKSTDGGKTWANTTAQPANYMGQQGEYDSAVAVDPHDDNIAYLVGLSGVLRTTNGGTSWVSIAADANGNGPHVDHHAAQVDAEGRLVTGNDGGAWRWDPSNSTWTNLNGGGLAITTFNGISSHPTNQDIVLGGSQDNGTEKFTGSQAWEHVDAGDGGQVYFDPINPNIAYHVLNGVLRKSTDGGNTWVNTSFNFPGLYFSFVVDPINSSRLVIAGTDVFESIDGGQSFTNLFTPFFNFPSEVAIASFQGAYQFDPDFPLVADVGANTYDPHTIYATNGFSLVVTKDHAQSWITRTPPGSGEIVSIAVDPRNRDTAFVVRQGEPGGGDNRIFKTTDAGQNWVEITGNLVDIPGDSTDIPFWKVIIDPRDGTLYLGTDQGVWRLNDGAGLWDRFGVGMPNVQVKQLDLNLGLNILTAGTYGRSAFQFHLDDVQADSGALRATSGLSTWTGPVRVAADSTISVGGSQAIQSGAAAATLDIGGIISDVGAANFEITKAGEGTLIFSGANTYGGLTRVSEGVLAVNNPDALGVFRPGPDIAAQGGTVVESGASLHLQTNLEGEPIVLNGNGVPLGLNGHNSGALRNISGNNTYTGTLTLNTDATVGVDSGSQLTIGTLPGSPSVGTIAGSSVLTKELTGTLILATANSGFTGGTTVNQGAVRVEHADALGTGPTGARVLDGAQMQLSTPSSGPLAGQPVVVTTPLVLSGTGIFGTGALLNAAGNNSWNGPISLDVLPGFSPNTFPSGAVSINVVGAANSLTLGGPIGEFAPTGITKIGPGELALTAGNGYSGATEVSQGTLNVRDPGALGTRFGTASVQRVITLSATQQGTFTLTFNGQSTTVNWGSFDVDVLAALESMSSIGTGNIASVTREEVQTMTQGGPGGPQTGFIYTVTFGGSLANTTTKLFATGANGTGADSSVVAEGGINVRVANGAALELDTTGTPSTGFTVAGHKLTLSGAGVNGHGALDNIAGSNTWSGPIEMLINTSVGANASSALALSGGISGAGLDLTKVDPGTVIFPTGGNNQNRTIINAGTVEVDGSINLVRLAGGRLSGTGTVGAISSTGAGGTINPGVTFPSDLIGTLNGSTAVLNSANTFYVDLSNPGSPTNDVLQLSGNINLANATLSGNVATNVDVGDQFTIIQAGSITGQFAGGTTVFIDNKKFTVQYLATSVVLTRQIATVSMGLTKTIASPVYGAREEFVATLTPESANLAVSGTVVFTVTDPDGNPFVIPIAINPATGTARLDPSLTSEFGNAALERGIYTVSASYDGLDSEFVVAFNPASAGPISATVSEAGSTTQLTSSVTPSQFGVTVTFTATVRTTVSAPVSNTLDPSGTVSFFDGATPLGSITLVPNAAGVFSTAQLSISTLVVGTHTITAVYNSDGVPEDNYLGSSSAPLTQTVTKSATTTVVASLQNPSNYGQPVTFTAEVDGAGTGVPTGTVTFRLGSVILGTAALNGSAVATFTTQPFDLPGGAQVITATYNGDSNFNGSFGTVTQNVNTSSSTTTVTTSGSPSSFGAPVTFTATVTSTVPGGTAPTGTVTFILNGTTTLGTGTLGAGGIVSITTTADQLPLGTHSITAEYSGDTTYSTSTGSVSQTVIASGSTTTLTATPTSAVATRAVTFTVHVGALAPGSGIPTGQVQFTDQRTGVVLGTATLDANGNATIVHHLGQPLGNHTVRADYIGDGSYAASSDTAAVSIVANGARASTVILASLSNPSIVGNAVTFRATVRDSGFAINPFGTVAFYDGSTLLGYGTLAVVSTGVTRVEFTTNALSLGSHSIEARYSGNATFARSKSPILTQVVKVEPTRVSSTSLAPLTGTSQYGESVTFTATVTDGGSGTAITPTGTVTFTDTVTNTVVGTATLTSTVLGQSTATLTTNVLNVGNHTIVATYNGDTDFAPGNPSNSVTHTVAQAGSVMNLTTSDGTAVFGQSITFKATMTSTTGAGVPTGTVTFKRDGVAIGTGTINAAGVATFTTSTLPVGSHTITAEYAGDTNFTGSTDGLAGPQQVAKSGTTATLGQSTTQPNTSVTFTATILAAAPSTATPTGSVTFVINGTVRGTVSLVNGVAQLILPNGLPNGSHTIVLQYSGDANFNARNTTFTRNFGNRG